MGLCIYEIMAWRNVWRLCVFICCGSGCDVM